MKNKFIKQEIKANKAFKGKMKRFVIGFWWLVLGIIIIKGVCAEDPVSWDLLDEDCSDISDWHVSDSGSFGTSVVDPPGQFAFHIEPATNFEYRHQDIGSFPNQFTTEIKLYHYQLGPNTLGHFMLYLNQGDYYNPSGPNIYESLEVTFASDGLFIYDPFMTLMDILRLK